MPKFLCHGFTIQPSPVSLKTAAGDILPVVGECSIEISSRSLRRSFVWNFVIADIKSPILGLDFLTSNKIIINCPEQTLTDSETNFRIVCSISKSESPPPVLAIPELSSDIQNLIDEYSTLFQPIQCQDASPESFIHRIDTGQSRPVAAKPRQLNHEKLTAAKEEFQRMLAAGIIRPSNSNWSSPLHMVKKARRFMETVWRLSCIELNNNARQLSNSTHPSHNEFNERLYCLLEARFGKSVPSGTHGSG